MSANNEVNEMKFGFNLQEILKRAVKYLIEGAAVAVAAFYIPKNRMKIEEVVMIAITAAATLLCWICTLQALVPCYIRFRFGIGANCRFPNS